MMLQWTKLDIGYPYFLNFQREIYLHMAACEVDTRCIGQLYTKCRRSGYTNICSSVLVDEATQVKDKLMGIQSKTGKDAQENIFMKKVVYMFRNYPFFFKPIQDGTTNPRMELAFREPSKRITKKNKTSQTGEALNTVRCTVIIKPKALTPTPKLFFDIWAKLLSELSWHFRPLIHRFNTRQFLGHR